MPGHSFRGRIGGDGRRGAGEARGAGRAELAGDRGVGRGAIEEQDPGDRGPADRDLGVDRVEGQVPPGRVVVRAVRLRVPDPVRRPEVAVAATAARAGREAAGRDRLELDRAVARVVGVSRQRCGLRVEPAGAAGLAPVGKVRDSFLRSAA